MNKEIKNWLTLGKLHTYKGNKTFYVDRGQGEVVLIIHGYPCCSFEWSPIIESLSRKYRVIAFDLLGMGASDKPVSHHYTYEEYVAITLSLLENLRISNVNLLAHDLGVSIVQEILASAQTTTLNIQIESVAFVNGGLFMDAYRPRLIQRLLSQTPDFIGKWLSNVLSRGLIEKSIKLLFGPNTKPSQLFLDQFWEMLIIKDGKRLTYLLGRLIFEKYKYQERWIKAMQLYNKKMCFINGPHDPNSGEHMAKRYEELIPNPLVFRMDKLIGHWPHVEDTKRFMELYENFLQLKK